MGEESSAAGSRGPVVVAGEALVDLVVSGDGAIAAHPGGGPFNAARAAARLGAPVAYLGRLSSDRFGADLRARLAADGVALHPALTTADPTTLALAEVDGDGAARYRFYAAGTSAPGLAAADAAAAMPPRPSALCVGTLGLVLEPAATTLEALVAAADAATLVLVDPNCRPVAVADEAAYRARLTRVLARADLVKASDEDLAWLVPGAEPAEALRGLLRAGAAGVVTRGGDGAVVVAHERETAVAAPPTEVLDTIGAGDAFTGALLAWWHERGRPERPRHDELVEAARFACRVAARTCERAGAQPPRRDEL